jgi:N-acetylmuramic acid 6-phosphate etherase
VSNDVSVSAPTEDRHPGTTGIDTLSTLEVLRALNDEDAKVAPAVAEVLSALAALVDATVAAIRAGGSVHYFGAGTSGRLAVLDAAELLPTFNAPPGLFTAHHAGGAEALLRAVENVEDDPDLGRAEAAALRPGDIAIGLTASGRTPFVGGALAAAREKGAVTALVTANPHAELGSLVDHLLAVDTGPEAIMGSTRLKAGTAQKLVLNAFSTAVMIRLGRTWSNLMVDAVATNAKLRGRVLRILCEASGADEAQARAALEQAGGELKPALLSMLAGVSASAAREAIEQHHGSVAQALQTLQVAQPGQAGQPAGHQAASEGAPRPEDSQLSTTVTPVPTGETA